MTKVNVVMSNSWNMKNASTGRKMRLFAMPAPVNKYTHPRMKKKTANAITARGMPTVAGSSNAMENQTMERSPPMTSNNNTIPRRKKTNKYPPTVSILMPKGKPRRSMKFSATRLRNELFPGDVSLTYSL